MKIFVKKVDVVLYKPSDNTANYFPDSTLYLDKDFLGRTRAVLTNDSRFGIDRFCINASKHPYEVYRNVLYFVAWIPKEGDNNEIFG